MATHPDWTALYQLAEPQSGHFTTAQAADAGYSRSLLNYYLRQGKFEHAARGIYRLTHFPLGEHEDLVVAWLWSDRQGVFSHETALALRRLSDVLPSSTHMTLPASWKSRRLKAPAGVRLYHSDVSAQERDWVGAVPVTNPLRTIADCARAGTALELLEQAIHEGLDRGLFAHAEIRKALVGTAARNLVPPRPRRRAPAMGRRGAAMRRPTVN